MRNASDPYRRLQQHLDRLPVGFPRSGTGADIRLLKQIFTPKQAAIAACLSYEPRPLERIASDVPHLVRSEADLLAELTEMVNQGGLEVRLVKGIRHYANAPLVVGMYELQAERLTLEFIRDFKTYTNEKPFGISFLSTPKSQMRTIPINQSISPEMKVADFDRINALLDQAAPPFVILTCICRKKKAMAGENCKRTQRTETCLAMGHVAQTLMDMGAGRQISRAEAKEIIRMNQEDGLVLQPANSRQVAFICSCCGCCCSMLSLQSELPLPLDFWTANFRANLDQDRCISCGKCIRRCQTNALARHPSENRDKTLDAPRFNRSRCIGCGLCVPDCPTQALTLVKVRHQTRPAKDRDAFNRELMKGKPGIQKIKTIAKLAKGIALTGDLRLLRSTDSTRGDT